MFPLEFWGEVNQDETIVMGYHPVSLSRFGMIPACDGQAYGQNLIIANTALCIASYADAL